MVGGDEHKENRGLPILSPLDDLVDFDFTEPLGKYRFFEVLADDVPAYYPWLVAGG